MSCQVKTKYTPDYMISFPPTDDKTILPELLSFQGKTECINIVEKISTKWQMVGTTLLDDRDGTIMPGIKMSCLNDMDQINMEILSRWIRGPGIADRTWHGLHGVLKLHCKALAESVEEALTVEEATDTRQGKQITYVIHSIPTQ